jgi:glyoxalase family protein
MKPAVHGLHHITAIAGDPRQNLDFYVRILGLRLVKKSVNQDSPDTYHLFYADAEGSPGTDLTFFPWPGMRKARVGAGMCVEVPFAIPEGSLGFWKDRFDREGVRYGKIETRFGETTLPFEDPDGLQLALVEIAEDRPFARWEKSTVPVEHQLRGMHAGRTTVRDLEPTETLLTRVMGFQKVATEGEWTRYAAGEGGSGTYAEVRHAPDAGGGYAGVGGVHHIAWTVRDAEEELALREVIEQVGLAPSPKIDRFWFESVYFREPGGVLFELATEGPGFERDEEADRLGEKLILPPWMEHQRAQIEAGLPDLGGEEVGK